MSRLYYEASTTTPGLKNGDSEGAKEYLEKVAKLIPGEIIAGYITLIGLVPSIKDNGLHTWFYGGIFLLCLFLTPYYLNKQAEKGKPKTVHLILSTIAFVLWAYAVSGGAVWPAIHDPGIASILLGAYSLISGKIPLS